MESSACSHPKGNRATSTGNTSGALLVHALSTNHMGCGAAIPGSSGSSSNQERASTSLRKSSPAPLGTRAPCIGSASRYAPKAASSGLGASLAQSPGVSTGSRGPISSFFAETGGSSARRASPVLRSAMSASATACHASSMVARLLSRSTRCSWSVCASAFPARRKYARSHAFRSSTPSGSSSPESTTRRKAICSGFIGSSLARTARWPVPCDRAASAASARSVTSTQPGLLSRLSSSASSARNLSAAPVARSSASSAARYSWKAQVPELVSPLAALHDEPCACEIIIGQLLGISGLDGAEPGFAFLDGSLDRALQLDAAPREPPIRVIVLRFHVRRANVGLVCHRREHLSLLLSIPVPPSDPALPIEHVDVRIDDRLVQRRPRVWKRATRPVHEGEARQVRRSPRERAQRGHTIVAHQPLDQALDRLLASRRAEGAQLEPLRQERPDLLHREGRDVQLATMASSQLHSLEAGRARGSRVSGWACSASTPTTGDRAASRSPASGDRSSPPRRARRRAGSRIRDRGRGARAPARAPALPSWPPRATRR